MLVMLDRDGVINEDRKDYVKSPGELALIPGSAEAVARLNTAGHKVAVVTNQACVGRGIIDDAMLDRIHHHLRDELARHGAHLDDLRACADAPWAATEFRKPGPGMLLAAMRHFRVKAAEAVMIGDSLRDLQAAERAGCRRILVRTGHGAATQADGIPRDVLPVAVADDLTAAVAMLLQGDA
jgi:D-glycero-D-manno-heptose 1,7-bisphosphate phosphatase